VSFSDVIRKGTTKQVVISVLSPHPRDGRHKERGINGRWTRGGKMENEKGRETEGKGKIRLCH